jgi:hypothetical protein
MIKLSDNSDGLETYSSVLGFNSVAYIPGTTIDANLNSQGWVYSVNLITKKVARVSTGNYTWPNNVIFDAMTKSLFLIAALEDGSDVATIFSLKPNSLAMSPIVTYSDPGNLGIVTYAPTSKTFVAASNGAKSSNLLTLPLTGKGTSQPLPNNRIEGLFYDANSDNILVVLSGPRTGGGASYSLNRLDLSNGDLSKVYDINMTSYGPTATMYPVALNSGSRSLLMYVAPQEDTSYFIAMFNVDTKVPSTMYFVPQPASGSSSFFTIAASFFFA